MARRDAVDALIHALAAGQPLTEAARTAGISRTTAWRRLADPAVQQQVRAARASLFEQALGTLAGGLTGAVAALVRNLDAEQPSVQVRYRRRPARGPR